MRTRIVLALLLVLGAGSARAEDSACAKFQDPLAYNACLARRGPRAGATLAAPGPAAAAPAARGARSMRAFAGGRRTRGRVHMEFTIKRG